MTELFTGWVLPCLYSFVACVGFCFVFNIHGPGMLICGGGGALGWLIYLLTDFVTSGGALSSRIMAGKMGSQSPPP